MKRTMMMSTAIALMLAIAMAVTASAQSTPASTPAAPGACQNGNWVDANSDGVCDNAPRDGTGQQFGQQGMGQRQGMGNGQGMSNGQQETGQGANFVDQDKDGICDNFAGQQHGPRDGSGQGMGSRAGRGMHSMRHGMRGDMGGGAQN